MAHILRIDTVAANTGDLEPTEGDARRSHTLRVGRYAQHFVDALQMDSNPVEYLLNKYPKVSALLSRARMASRQAEGGMMQAACQEWRKGTLLICRYMLQSISSLCGDSRRTTFQVFISSIVSTRIGKSSRGGIS